MKRIFILLCGLFLVAVTVAGCSNVAKTSDKTENTGFQMASSTVSIGAVEETKTDIQKLSYEFVMTNDKHKAIQENSVEIMQTDWLKDLIIDQQITEITIHMDDLVIKGYIIFDTKGLTKEEIVSNEPFLEGVKFSTVDGAEHVINHHD
ncbi:hypothetical protein ACFSCX_24315 [Bacillus salitolerans]|uniref:Lipoprotein n=1 Tax=Bacillus salitolerans TaxID=1437434 RepID=A0ABW4LWW9_9BACI